MIECEFSVLSIGQGLVIDGANCQDRFVFLDAAAIFQEVIIVIPNATFNGIVVPPNDFGGIATSLSRTMYFLDEGQHQFIFRYELAGNTATCDFTITVGGLYQVYFTVQGYLIEDDTISIGPGKHPHHYYNIVQNWPLLRLYFVGRWFSFVIRPTFIYFQWSNQQGQEPPISQMSCPPLPK